MLLSPLFLLLLSIFRLAASQQQPPHLAASLPYVSSRGAFPRHVSGNWTLIYTQNDTICPRQIQHLGFNRNRQGLIRIFHHRIIQDGARCKNPRQLKGGRRFRFYHSQVVRAAVNNQTTPYRIARRLIKLLKISTPVRRAFRAANRHREAYLIGFEGHNRFCGGKRIFKRGTTAFVFRPSRRRVTIKGLGVSLTPGKRYLIMIPLFKRISCVYSSDVRDKQLNATNASEDKDEPAGEPGDELEASTDSRACFPATASVHLADGRHVFMKDLAIRDSVQVGANQYASVFMFTHRLRSSPSIFRRIELDSGEALEVTSGHYVYANGKLITASQVGVGDMMPLANGTHARVKALYTVAGMGLYNPQTTHGDLIVNGIRVSTYTEAIKPRVAHTILTPLRAGFRIFNVDLSFGYLGGVERSSQSSASETLFR